MSFIFIHNGVDKGLCSLGFVEWRNFEDLDREFYTYEDSVQVKRDYEFAHFKLMVDIFSF